MKKLVQRIGIALLIVATVWLLLTIWVEIKGPARSWELGNQASPKTALVVYDPDPFYNLDEQISRSFGQTLAKHGLYVHVATVAAASEFDRRPTDLYVFCANTYNGQPDWAVSNFIENQVALAGKPVVAITVGAGSTQDSQKALENIIRHKKGVLFDSHSFWLARPNDESRLNESNVDVAVSMASQWAGKLAERLIYWRK